MATWTKSQLPAPANDFDKVANDIDRWGYGFCQINGRNFWRCQK